MRSAKYDAYFLGCNYKTYFLTIQNWQNALNCSTGHKLIIF